MTQSLIIKDGAGTTKSLAVESGSYGFIPQHVISSSNSSPVYISGAVTVNNPVSTLTASIDSSLSTPVYVTGTVWTSPRPVSTVTYQTLTSFTWGPTEASGTFEIAADNSSRKGIVIFNPGPHNLYVVLAEGGDPTNGFQLTSINSAPSRFSFIVYPSGTFFGDETNSSLFFGGYFISGAASTGVYATMTS